VKVTAYGTSDHLIKIPDRTPEMGATPVRHHTPGQKLLVIVDKNRIVLVPDQPIHASRGALKGMDISVERDEADRI
jgi:hypothetical protein